MFDMYCRLQLSTVCMIPLNHLSEKSIFKHTKPKVKTAQVFVSFFMIS
jgi:hypothetical protein